ncbi:MAG: hypothetical protein A2539_10480 [Elusimicrobia bacterium RIFOXYD2_FULL_34_15]|nr:MAG: hypothetical protein A2539_10480 [Elusimicrobia bacterium RIFOXYD2_FULL_34_15]
MKKIVLLITGSIFALIMLIFLLNSRADSRVNREQYEYIVLNLERQQVYQQDDERVKTTSKLYTTNCIFTGNGLDSKIACPLIEVNLATNLNELGELGWELITITFNKEYNVYLAYFKRKK